MTFSGPENNQFKFRGIVMWIFRSRGQSNNGGHENNENNENNAFFSFGMWLTALASLITLYHYGSCENKAFSGIIVLVITLCVKLKILSFAT